MRSLIQISFWVPLVVSLFCFGTADGADFDSWNQAVTALEQREFPQAAAHFDKWIEETKARGLYSLNAHHNAALAYRGAGRPGKAVYHLVQAMHHTANPLANFDTTNRISDVEREAGLREGLSNSLLFIFGNLVSPELGGWLASIGAWMLVLMIAAQGIHLRGAGDVLMRGLGLTVLLLGLAGLFSPRFLSNYYVLDGEGEVKVYSSSTPAADEEPSALLPPGAIVSVRSRSGNSAQVDGPVSGWIDSTRLLGLGS